MKNELFLQHHGILGQKWGIRRYQNKDGTLTEAGKNKLNKQEKKIKNRFDKFNKNENENQRLLENLSILSKETIKVNNDFSKIYRDQSKYLINKISKIDQELGKELIKKYSPMLDKVFVTDFTLNELKRLKKNPEQAEGKAKKFIEQFNDQKLSNIQINNEIRRKNNLHLQQQMQMLQQQMLHQQINMQFMQLQQHNYM